MTLANIHEAFNRPHLIGFDHLFDELDRISNHPQDNYPPHNVVKLNDTQYVIELAVAGFSEKDIDIELKDQSLKITGTKDSEPRNYVHRGISSKRFVRTFKLADDVVVQGANLVDGILTIDLELVIPEEKQPRKIEISYSQPQLLTEHVE